MHISRYSKHILILVCTFLIILLIGFRSDTAFRYETDSPNSSFSYGLTSGEQVTQHIFGQNLRLSGVKIRFGTYVRVNTGTLTIELREGKKLLRSCSLDTSYLSDNAFHEFDFSRAVNLKQGHEYDLIISDVYEGDSNQIAIYASDDSNGLTSSLGGLKGSLCFQLVGVWTGLQRLAVILAILMTAVFLFFYFRSGEILNAGIVRPIVITICMLAVVEIASTDLFPSIVSNVVVKHASQGYSSSPFYQEVKSGETWTTEVENYYSKSDAIELFTQEDPSSDISLKITGKDDGASYLDQAVTSDELVYDQHYGRNAVEIPAAAAGLAAFPEGTYEVSVTNNGDSPVSIMANADESGNITSVDAAFLKHTMNGYRLALFAGILLAIYVYLVFMLGRKRKLTAEKYFLIAVVPLAIIYFVLFAPWNMPDTGSHFQAAYRFSNVFCGHGTSWVIRQDDLNFYQSVWSQSCPSMENLLGVWNNAHLRIADGTIVAWPDPDVRMEYYSMFCYLPGALGMAFTRMLRLGTVPMIYMGRLFTLIVSIAALYHAVKTTPVGKVIFAGTSLFPMYLMYSGTVSYDSMVIASTACFIACVLRLYFEPSSKRYLLESVVWAFVIGGVKGGGYLILLPLAFILFDRDKWKYSLKKIAVIIAAGVLSVLFFDVILPAGSSLFQFGEDATGYLAASDGFAHPVLYFDIVVKTYLKYMDALLINMAGNNLSLLEGTIPAVIVIGMMLVCGISAIFEKDSMVLKKKDRNIFLFVIFLEFYFTPIMLLSWTPVNNPVIEGLQGRYFIPVLPLIFMVLTKFMLHDTASEVKPGKCVSVQKRCMWLFTMLSVVSVYYLLRLYLTR